MAGGRRHSYSRWDGTQAGLEPDGLDVFSEITDDLLYHGDLQAALRRLLQEGFDPPDGDRVQGIRDLLERLRQARRERLEQNDLGSVYGDLAERLREIVRQEREALDDLAAEARESGDERRIELTDEVVSERSMRLDLLPPDLAGQIRELSDHDFTSHEAGQAFDELLDELRSDLARRFIDDVTGAVGGMTEADRARMKDMMAALRPAPSSSTST